jgi:heat shock protein HslJ
MEGNKAIVNYVDRAPGEDFSVQPSIGKSLYLQFDKETLRLIQVEVNFEGEADPNVMTLDMKTWKWIKTTYNNDTELAPKNKEAFTLTFKDGKFSATTDCNSMSGAYEVNDKKIAFKDAVSTLKYCEGSQEVEFSKMLDEIQSFFFTGKGELIFELKVDSGSAIFK